MTIPLTAFGPRWFLSKSGLDDITEEHVEQLDSMRHVVLDELHGIVNKVSLELKVQSRECFNI